MTDSTSISTNVDVFDNDDGTYTLSYRIFSKGKHAVAIYVRDKPIFDNPFEINVTAGIDVAKVGQLLTKFGSAGIGGLKNDENYEPWGVACDVNGNIVVSDHNNHKIQVVYRFIEVAF